MVKQLEIKKKRKRDYKKDYNCKQESLMARDKSILGEIYLWRKVLDQARKDIFFPDKKGREAEINRYNAIKWIGTRDFRVVCDLADLSYSYIKREFRSEMNRLKIE